MDLLSHTADIHATRRALEGFEDARRRMLEAWRELCRRRERPDAADAQIARLVDAMRDISR